MSFSHDAIVEMLQQARPMVSNFARNYHLEFDELMQEAALVVVETGPKIPADAHPYAYLQSTIRYHLLALIQRRHLATASLDEPLSSESAATYADMLAAPEPVAYDEPREDQRQEALYTALHTLPLEEQQYFREVYALNAFNPSPPNWPCSANYNRSRKTMSMRAFSALRRNAALREVVCNG